ncbi:unnamed protein product, partial [Durusdinium trenchii]
MDTVQFQNFQVQLHHPPCTVKNTFLNVAEENVSSDEELYTPFERCNMSAPPVLQDPAYVRTDVAAARDYYMRLPGPLPHILQVSFPEQLNDEGPQARRMPGMQGPSSKEMELPKIALSEEIEPRPGVQPMKSKGSTGHPENCKECTFYFFSAAGCRNGADCCFCHEFHPRKNSKKNRRIMRTLQTRGHDASDSKEIQELPKTSVELKKLDHEKEPVKAVKDVKAEGAQGSEVPHPVGGDGTLCVSYDQDGAADNSAPVALTLIQGVRAFL